MNPTSPNGRSEAKCQLCGKVIAQFPHLDIPIIGQPDEKTRKVLTILGTHIATKHTDKFAAGMALVQDFQAFLILTQFQVTDPSIAERAEAIRAGMQALTRKFTLNDRQLDDAIIGLESAGQLNAENVKALIRQMRDVLTESGDFAPKVETIQTPQSSLIV